MFFIETHILFLFLPFFLLQKRKLLYLILGKKTRTKETITKKSIVFINYSSPNSHKYNMNNRTIFKKIEDVRLGIFQREETRLIIEPWSRIPGSNLDCLTDTHTHT